MEKKLNKVINEENLKIDKMKEVIYKSIAKESSITWNKHTPIYGWTKMNYPSSIQPCMIERYKKEQDKLQIEAIEKPINKLLYIDDDIYCQGNKYRLDPISINKVILNDMENLFQIDYTKKFMKNYKQTDLKFFQENFKKFNDNKSEKSIQNKERSNYNFIINSFQKKYLYELGYKKAFAILTTDNFDEKCNFIDLNLFFERKYSNMFPKNSCLGIKPDNNFSKKSKKIGDISFEENNQLNESVRDLNRLPPDFITDESIKDNLNDKIELLKLENCLWLSNDVISKLGRLNPKMKELSLRNMTIDNQTLLKILEYTPNLEYLDISNCFNLTKGILRMISDYAKNLKSLNLSGLCKAVDDQGLQLLSNSKITDLDISLCNQVTDSGLMNIKEPLTKLNLTGLYNLSDSSGLKFILSNSIKTLNDLSLSLLPQKFIDNEICQIINKCKCLINLDLQGCISMSNDGIYSLFVGGLNLLETANFSGIPSLDDNSVSACISSNKNLKTLRLSNCPLLTNNLLDYLINSSSKILVLELNRTPLIKDEKILETLNIKAPNLRIIRSTNLKWDTKLNGYKVPLPNPFRPKPFVKGITKPDNKKKNDEKSISNQLKKLKEEMKPKRIIDLKTN